MAAVTLQIINMAKLTAISRATAQRERCPPDSCARSSCQPLLPSLPWWRHWNITPFLPCDEDATISIVV